MLSTQWVLSQRPRTMTVNAMSTLTLAYVEREIEARKNKQLGYSERMGEEVDTRCKQKEMRTQAV